MARDASGTYTRVVTPPVNGDVANATDFNSEINDFAAEITASLEASGKKTWTGNQNANGYGVKTLANTKVHTTAGGTTAYTVTTGAAFTAYTQLPLIFVKANATNTGSMTVSVDAIGALTVKKNGATNLASGDFVQDYIYALAYDGTNLQLIGGSLATIYQPLDATLTAFAGLTTADDRMLDFTGVDTMAVVTYATVLSNIGALASASYTAADVLSKLLTVDGSGSGLDADLLDGISSAGFSKPGKICIPIPASAMVSRTSNGAAVGLTESTTNKVMMRTLDFDASTQEYAQFTIPAMPKSWNEGTITARFIWTTTGSTNYCVWGMQAVAISSGEAVDTAWGTGVSAAASPVSAANYVLRSDETAAITIGNSPAEGDAVVFQVYRDATSGNDSLTVDALLIGVELYITTDASNDA